MDKYNLIFDGDSIIISSNDFYDFKYSLVKFIENNTYFNIKELRSFDFETLEIIITDILNGEIKYFHKGCYK